MSYESQTKFDSELKNKICHYRVHEKMLPFIGEHFEKYRVLLISESHYLPEGEKAPIDDSWYSNSKEGERLKGNHHTRGVIKHFKHRLFTNIQSELKSKNQSLNFKFVAWYNFFQKPALNRDSIKKNLTPKDIEISQEVFEKLIKILQPNAVVFLSKLAFDSIYKDKEGKIARNFSKERKCHLFKNNNVPIYWAQHPNSPSWNNTKMKVPNGRTRFKSALDKVIVE